MIVSYSPYRFADKSEKPFLVFQTWYGRIPHIMILIYPVCFDKKKYSAVKSLKKIYRTWRKRTKNEEKITPTWDGWEGSSCPGSPRGGAWFRDPRCVPGRVPGRVPGLSHKEVHILSFFFNEAHMWLHMHIHSSATIYVLLSFWPSASFSLNALRFLIGQTHK